MNKKSEYCGKGLVKYPETKICVQMWAMTNMSFFFTNSLTPICSLKIPIKPFFTDIALGLDCNLGTMAIWEEVEDIIL